MALSLIPRPPQLQEESGPVRIDQEVQKKNLPRPPLPHKKDIPVSIGTCSPAKLPVIELPKPFSRTPQPEVHLLGLTDHSARRLKPEDDLPRPCLDPKSPASKTMQSRGSIPVGGKLREFAKEWMGTSQDPFMFGIIQEHFLQFNQKPP